MREITLEELLEAGCHFGHQVTRQNPKARDFVFEARDGIHIIDLAKTKEGLEDAAAFVKALASKGGSLIIVGTKRQARGIVEEEIKKVNESVVQSEDKTNGLFFVISRWIGGTLTNFPEVTKNYKKLKELTTNLQDEEFKSKYTKKEIGLWGKERQKLLNFYGGTYEMTKIPDALFIIDTHLEDIVVKEAKKMGVTTVGIVDTNGDPDIIAYPIPANDDAVGSLKLIISFIIDAWIEGKQEEQKLKIKDQKQEQNLEVKKEEATSETKQEEKKAEVKKETKKPIKPKKEKKEEENVDRPRTVKKAA